MAKKKETILEEAQRVTSGQREIDYGHPKENHERIAGMWNAYNRFCKKVPSADDTASDITKKMILLKMVRDGHKAKKDNPFDTIGYARAWARIDGYEP